MYIRLSSAGLVVPADPVVGMVRAAVVVVDEVGGAEAALAVDL